jgi:competence protein ComEC
MPKRLAPAFATSIVLLSIMILAFFLGLYPSGQKESGRFKIHEVKKNVSSIQTTIAYIGTLDSLPCRIYLRKNDTSPLANKDYFFSKGTLRERSKGHYIFKPESPWEPIEKSWSLAEWRFQIKEKVKKRIHNRFKNPKVAALLSGLATGNLENPYLSYHFGAVGLAHLLAISGFHFALLTFFLASILKQILSEKLLALALILLLGTYFFYMGGGPSISRAWIGVLLYLVGILFGYRTTPLNALGVALLFALLSNPFVITNVGFQLSFGATLGIILFYRLFEEKLTSLLPKRPYPVLTEMSTLDQCGYILCAYLRKGLALQGSVLTFTLPLILFHFETFPLISIFYNLFVPFLFAALLALFLLHTDIFAAPIASFLVTLVEGTPRKLLLKINTVQALILGSVILGFVYWRSFRKRKKKSCKTSPSH